MRRGPRSLPVKWVTPCKRCSLLFGASTMDGHLIIPFVLATFRDGYRRFRHMAAYHHADPDRSPDRWLWSADTGLRHRKIAPRTELAEHLAAHARHGNRHTDWRDAADPRQSGPYAF